MRRAFAILILLLCFAPVGYAQSDRSLLPGIVVSGVIDSQHLAQIYRFDNTDSSPGGGLALKNTGAIPLSAVLIDAEGNPVNHMTETLPNTDGGMGWSDLKPGTYYVIVLPTQGIGGGQGSFSLSLTGSQTALAATGFNLQVVLTWQVGARLSLEVRDPQGQSLHWHNTKTDDSGEFVGDTNAIDCQTFAPHDQTQAARWQTEPGGSYEILVHYIDGCDQSVPFTISVRLGDQTFPLISGTAQPNQTFVSGFVVNSDSSGAINAVSGMVSDTPTLTIPTADLIANAQPFGSGAAQSGMIDSDHPYRSYSFDGSIGQQISLTAQHVDGNLDTLVALIDANGNLIALNDDASDTVTDSELDNVRLPRSERYYLIVTRYAELVGATEGDFLLTVTGLNS